MAVVSFQSVLCFSRERGVLSLSLSLSLSPPPPPPPPNFRSLSICGLKKPTIQMRAIIFYVLTANAHIHTCKGINILIYFFLALLSTKVICERQTQFYSQLVLNENIIIRLCMVDEVFNIQVVAGKLI